MPSDPGDSGGAYLLLYNGKHFIIGTHNGNTAPNEEDATGTYFLADEWTSINSFFETAQNGNVTTSEPTNLVVGTNETDVITGSYRPDILLGRGGYDSINDGDEPGDLVWANDTLVGGDGGDIFFAGRGNDIIWGGNVDEEIDEAGNGEDQISYALPGAAPVTLRFNGSETAVSLTASSADIDTDTLHAIERIVLTDGDDSFIFGGRIPVDYRLTVDAWLGTDVVANAAGAATNIVLDLDEQGMGTLTSPGGGTIYLRNFHTMIIGSAFDSPDRAIW